jgi:molecular chaperone GrpE
MEKEVKQNQEIKNEDLEDKNNISDLTDENIGEVKNEDLEDKNNISDLTDENIGEVKNEDGKKEISPEERIKELEDKLVRTFAEMENQRRRFEKEKNDAFDYGGFVFAKEALNIIDNLERSKQILENDEKLKETEALKKTIEHLDIINKDLISIFTKNNIKPIESLNKKLDPNYHQAMMEIENDQKEPGTIVQEIQKGFMIKDRLLRPSLVGVSKKTEKKDEKIEVNKENLNK